MAKETNLELYTNTDRDYEFPVLDETETTAINITGWALSFMIKRSIEDPDRHALVTKTTGAGIVISGSFNVDPTLNTQLATVSVADSDTERLTAAPCVYELRRTDAGFETPLAFGKLSLKQSVHRT